MPTFHPATEKELAAIRQSVVNARFSIRFGRMGLRRMPAERFVNRELVVDERSLLLLYRFVEGREGYPLNSPPVKKIIQHALDSGDAIFFVRLGRVLARPPLRWGTTGKLNRLEQFLLDHWAERRDNLPELFYLTPQGLSDVCVHFLKPNTASDHDYTPEALVKVRQRLGLKSFARGKVPVIRVGMQLRFLSLDNK